MRGFVRRLIDCKDYYCNISPEAKWLNYKSWIVEELFFAYRKQITVTEQSGNDLTDYQVLIELNSGNFDFSHANDDGSDIRFHDGNNFLDYWIEKWDSVNQEAKAWVKVPSISANGTTTFYMYYGNSNVASASDGVNTFDLFEDFDPDKQSWTIVSGNWNNETGYEGNSKRGVHDGSPGARKSLAGPFVSIADFILHAKVRSTVEGSLANIVYRAQTNDDYGDNRLWARIDYRENSSLYGFYLLKDEGGTEYYTTPTGSPQLNQWYDVMIKVHDNVHELYIDGNFIASQETTITSAGYILLQVEDSGGDDTWFDNIIIRKYADPEPSVSVGDEETP